jgi:peptide/nickel transport system ATP-binding protein
LAAVPDPNPDNRLDLSALMDGRASNPAAWPPPFTLERRNQGEMRLALIDLGDGHHVCADPSADVSKLTT